MTDNARKACSFPDKNNPTSGRTRSPWGWIPSVYIAEGLPYFAVNTLTVLMYNNLGISKSEMAFFTGWLYLPWVIKPFWSPFVDLFRTKRWWTLTTELLIALAMGGVALLLPSNAFFAATLAVFWIMAFLSATHDIAADGYYMLALDSKRQAAFVGVRSTFYRIASVLGQGGLVMLAGFLETACQSIPVAWSLTFATLSLCFLLIFLLNMTMMPRPALDKPVPGVSPHTIAVDFGKTFVTFFQKPHIASALAFMLLYRLPEALCLKMVQPFLVDSRAMGGLALSTSQVGMVNGTVGVIALLAGGIAGGLVIARGGLRKWLWPMALCHTLTCGVYCWLAMTQPENILLTACAIAVEQAGYGFGFTAFMMYLMYFSRGESQTSHYAFCTAFMALGMMIPGMAAGWIYEMLTPVASPATSSVSPGYIYFFWTVMASCAATFAVVAASRPHIRE